MTSTSISLTPTQIEKWQNLTPKEIKENNQRNMKFAAFAIILLIGSVIAAYYAVNATYWCSTCLVGHNIGYVAILPIISGLSALGLLYEIVTNDWDEQKYGTYKRDLKDNAVRQGVTVRQGVIATLQSGTWQAVFDEHFGSQWNLSFRHNAGEGNGGAAPLVRAGILTPEQGVQMNDLANDFRRSPHGSPPYDERWREIYPPVGGERRD